ncbi:MAG: hypothetical protein M3126_08150, partial [Candidatus Eremiobacteraeota bacterium]|nr:hypothetical protein [Candidatus Eremiobacteraeota bacterium]
MIAFAQACESVAATASKREKIRLVGDYLATLRDADLAAAARYFTGNPFAARDQRSLALGGRSIVAAAQAVWGFTDAQLGLSYREYGDLGAALCPFVRPAATLALFTDVLTPAFLKTILDEIADAAGKAAGRKRQLLCERILGACATGPEAKYVIKIMTGDLRIGLREGLVIDAIASAFARPVRDVRRATMAAGDIGAVAVNAKAGTLDAIAVSYGAPIGSMLASPVTYGSSYKELAGEEWVVEDKFDGIRAQVHKDGSTVRIFSRTLNDVSHSYPEIVDAVRKIDASVILDGEIIARRNGRVLPFRYLQARLQRKDVSADLLAEVPVAYACFDVLAHNDAFLLDKPLL